MKLLKTIVSTLLILLLTLAAIFTFGRYGWKLLGFEMCEGAAVQSVEVKDAAVRIRGCYPGSFPEGFCGYYAEERDGRLCVGFHFSGVFGFFETGDFDVTIPVKGEIQEVILKTKQMQRSLWTAKDGDAAAEERLGVYVRLERGDVRTLFLRGGVGDFASGERMDVLPQENGEWIFIGECIAQLAKEENRSVLFTVSALAEDDTILAESAFLYDISQEKLYVTIAEDGVTCSTSNAPGAAADVPPILTLPILDEIDRIVTIGTAGSYSLAIQAAAKLLSWGEATGLGTDEIAEAASTWLAAFGGSGPEGFLHKLGLVDEVCGLLLGDEARELLDSAGCENMPITWGSIPPEPVEAIMQAAGLR